MPPRGRAKKRARCAATPEEPKLEEVNEGRSLVGATSSSLTDGGVNGSSITLRESSSSSSSGPDGSVLFAKLPLEIRTLIFEQVDESDPLASAIKIASVCRLWRESALDTPSLWSRATNFSILPYPALVKTFNVRSLLVLCAERSRDGITHLDLRSLASQPVHLAQCVDIIRRSAGTLVDLKIADDALCACRSCAEYPLPAATRAFKHGSLPIGLAMEHETPRHAALLVAQAPRLQKLTLQVRDADAPSSSIDVANLASVPELRAISILVQRGTYNSRQLGDGVQAWLEQATLQVQDFAFYPMSRCLDWEDWAWETVCRTAHQLRRCQIHPHTARRYPLKVLDMPLLQEMTLYGALSHSGTANLSPVWFEAPHLLAIRLVPEVTMRINCPSVEAVSLLFPRSGSQLRYMPQMFRAWRNLRTLTLELDGQGKGTLEALLDFLCPSRCGTLHASLLKNLGIVSAASLFLGDFMDRDLRWAASPWTIAETQRYYHSPLSKPTETYGRQYAELPANILKIVAQRRQLSEGRSVRITSQKTIANVNATSVRGPCAALESIKLAGVYVDRSLYQSLLDIDDLEVSCYPDPFQNPD